MSKPTTVPRWCNSPTTLRTEPAEGTKDVGFAVNAKLPAQYFNWLIGLICDWWTWVTSYVSFDTGTVGVTGSVTTTTYLQAGTYVKPTAANDVVLTSSATELRVATAAGAAIPAHVGVGTDSDHAVTSRWLERASAMMTTPLSVADGAEADFVFDTEEYDSSTLWSAGAGSRMIAPVTGYYHVSIWGKLIKGAVTLSEFYVALKHSADNRVLTEARHGGDWGTTADGAHVACGIDVYLEAGQYVYARVYQDSSVGALTVIGRYTMHRIG